MDSSSRSFAATYRKVEVATDLEVALHADARRHQSNRRILAIAAGFLALTALVAVAAVSAIQPSALSTTKRAERFGLVRKFGMGDVKNFFGIEENDIDEELSPEQQKKFDKAMELAKNTSVTKDDLQQSEPFKALTDDLQKTVLKAHDDLEKLAPTLKNLSSKLNDAKATVKNETAKLQKEKDKLKKDLAGNASNSTEEKVAETLVSEEKKLEDDKDAEKKVEAKEEDAKKEAKAEFSKLPATVGGEVGNLGFKENTTSVQCSDRCATEADDKTVCSNAHFINGMCISCKAYRTCCNTHEECDCGCVNNNVAPEDSCGSACKTGKPDTKCYWSAPLTCEVFVACFDDKGDGIFVERDIKSTQCKQARTRMNAQPVC